MATTYSSQAATADRSRNRRLILTAGDLILPYLTTADIPRDPTSERGSLLGIFIGFRNRCQLFAAVVTRAPLTTPLPSSVFARILDTTRQQGDVHVRSNKLWYIFPINADVR